MEFETSRVLIEKQALEIVIKNLEKIKKTSEEEINYLATEALEALKKNDCTSGECSFEGETLIEQIKYKMRTTKDKDLNLKLYILYRKLEDGKIPEIEALKLYELYLETEYTDQYI